MRALLCASLVLLFATTSSAQFAKRAAALRGADKPADADAAKPAENPVAPADQAAGASSGLFAALDLDGDGTISKTELHKAIVSLRKLDTDKDGTLTMAECGVNANATNGRATTNNAMQWVDRIMANDKNNDGKLTPDELSENEKQMLQGADQNGDGAIDRQELTAAVNSRNAPGAGSAFGGTGSYGPAGARGNAVMARFFQYDRNHDGRLAPNEVPAQSRAMLNGGDTNGDGFIDAGEFQALAARMGERAKTFGAGNNLNAEANNGGRSR